MSAFFSWAASIGITIVVFTYFRQVIKGDSVPNPATWFIWAVVMTINAFTYVLTVDGNILKALVSIIAAVGLAIIFLYSLVKGKFNKVGWVEIISLILTLVIGVFWQTTGEAKLANLALQVILFISFIPTIIGLLRRELKEKSLPWIIAVTTYTLSIISILLDWQTGDWMALAYPFVNGVIGNGSVALIIMLQKR